MDVEIHFDEYVTNLILRYTRKYNLSIAHVMAIAIDQFFDELPDVIEVTLEDGGGSQWNRCE